MKLVKRENEEEDKLHVGAVFIYVAVPRVLFQVIKLKFSRELISDEFFLICTYF